MLPIRTHFNFWYKFFFFLVSFLSKVLVGNFSVLRSKQSGFFLPIFCLLYSFSYYPILELRPSTYTRTLWAIPVHSHPSPAVQAKISMEEEKLWTGRQAGSHSLLFYCCFKLNLTMMLPDHWKHSAISVIKSSKQSLQIILRYFYHRLKLIR